MEFNFYILTFDCGDCDPLIILNNLKTDQILLLAYTQHSVNTLYNEDYIIAF